MRKETVILLLASVLLTACTSFERARSASGQGAETSSSPAVVDTSREMEGTPERASIPRESEEGVEELIPASPQELEDAEVVTKWDAYPELVAQDHFQPEELTAYLITDNPGTRVFLFQDGSQQVYKTIYLKHEQQLKVVDLVQQVLVEKRMLD